MSALTAGKLRNSLKALSLSKIQQETEKIILNDKAVLQRKEVELKTSSTPDGNTIGEYRSDSYRLFKMQRNPLAGGKVDLFLTGAFIKGIRVLSLGSGSFTLRSTDGKRDKLITGARGYGIENEGINEEVWRGLQQTNYAPKLISALRKMI